jgi:hypothetical protein
MYMYMYESDDIYRYFAVALIGVQINFLDLKTHSSMIIVGQESSLEGHKGVNALKPAKTEPRRKNEIQLKLKGTLDAWFLGVFSSLWIFTFTPDRLWSTTTVCVLFVYVAIHKGVSMYTVPTVDETDAEDTVHWHTLSVISNTASVAFERGNDHL